MSGFDALVIGGGVNGLVAGSRLAQAGKRVLVLEARSVPGGIEAQIFYALDPQMVSELKLARHGLSFAARDLPLVGLRPDGRHVVVTRDTSATARSLAVHASADAEGWAREQRRLWTFAREMRSVWWDEGGVSDRNRERAERLQRRGAGAWLDARFESEALKAALAFDTAAASPLAAGTALLFAWHASQEMCGLQGAVAVQAGSAVTQSLIAAANHARAEIRLNARARELLIDRGAVKGVRLESGETILAPLVLSSLSRRATLLQLAGGEGLDAAARAMVERQRSNIGAARIVLSLDARPVFEGLPGDGRFVVAESWDSLATAHAQAHAGRIPDALTFAFILPGEAGMVQSGKHAIDIVAQPVPISATGDAGNMKPLLAAKVIAALQPMMPNLLRHIIGIDVTTPGTIAGRFGFEDEKFAAERLLKSWRDRIATPITGLFLCGGAAEPVNAVSGRAGRIAARVALSSGR